MLDEQLDITGRGKLSINGAELKDFSLFDKPENPKALWVLLDDPDYQSCFLSVRTPSPSANVVVHFFSRNDAYHVLCREKEGMPTGRFGLAARDKKLVTCQECTEWLHS